MTSIRLLRSAALSQFMLLLIFGSPVAFAESASPPQKQGVQGSWTLVSLYVEKDGSRTEAFGTAPRGSMVFTPDGHFSTIVMRANLPKFGSNSRTSGTDTENQAVVQGSIAYFGTYTENKTDGTLSLRIEGSTFPNWDGQVQLREFRVTNNELRLINPSAAIGGAGYMVWKRAGSD